MFVGQPTQAKAYDDIDVFMSANPRAGLTFHKMAPSLSGPVPN